ncbi:MAG: transporter substrate-binding domain-containing protein [Kiritimatiellia bacterium]
MKKFRLGWLGILALGTLLAACAKKEEPKVLVLGTSAEFPPFESLGGKDGTDVVGFDVEVAKAIAAKAGLPLKIETMPFDRLLPALAAGKLDFVLAGLTITPERDQTVDFSEPYYKATQAVLILAGGAVPEKKDELKGMAIGVQQGTTGEKAAVDLVGREKVRPFPTLSAAVEELLKGAVDAVVIDEQPAIQLAKKDPLLMLLRLGFEDEFYGVAVRPGDAELLATVNGALADIQTDGRYDLFLDQWLLQAD